MSRGNDALTAEHAVGIFRREQSTVGVPINTPPRKSFGATSHHRKDLNLVQWTIRSDVVQE